MPFYELFCISRANLAEHQTAGLLKTTILQILRSRGLVTSLANLGPAALPYRIKAHQEIFSEGRSWAIQFETSPRVKDAVERTMKLDERVVRCAVVRLARGLPKPAAP